MFTALKIYYIKSTIKRTVHEISTKVEHVNMYTSIMVKYSFVTHIITNKESFILSPLNS